MHSNFLLVSSIKIFIQNLTLEFNLDLFSVNYKTKLNFITEKANT